MERFCESMILLKDLACGCGFATFKFTESTSWFFYGHDFDGDLLFARAAFLLLREI